jgi:hypothetical protein
LCAEHVFVEAAFFVEDKDVTIGGDGEVGVAGEAFLDGERVGPGLAVVGGELEGEAFAVAVNGFGGVNIGGFEIMGVGED